MASPLLVTGSAGTIGRPLVAALQAQGWEVRRFDRRHAVDDGFGDVCRPEALRAALHGCQGVIHLAAVSRVAHAEADPARCEAVNAQATRMLAELAGREPGVRVLLLASSREVYGQAQHLPVAETCPPAPRNAYGRSKLAAEQAVLAQASEHLSVGVLRLANVYGAAIDHADRLVPAFVAAALAGRPLQLRGPERIVDLLHVDDAVRGFLLTLRHLQTGTTLPGPVNLASGVGVTLLDLAQRVSRLAGSQSPLETQPAPESDVERYVGDARLAQAVLGWRAEVALERGLRDVVAAARLA